MQEVRKAFVMLSAALAMGALSVEEATALKSKSKSPDGDKVEKGKEGSKQRVKKVRRARRRPADWDADLGMPAGTLYDVLAIDEVMR
jgi:hypothetical protein